MIPDRIGRYLVQREIAHGGFATVYEAIDERLDSTVAIKVLAEPHTRDPDLVRRFLDEARLMRQLRVPGLVTVYDGGEQDGRPYFVMEYCERGTLADRLARLDRPPTPQEGLGLAHAVAAAVSGVHRAVPPVVHRDLKPSNFLVRHIPNASHRAIGRLLAEDETLILGDFGLARSVDPEATQLSLIAYTRGFAAPEQVRGDPAISLAADVYAASAVIVTALTGVSPQQVIVPEQHAFDEATLARTAHLRPALERGLAYRPQDRPADIGAWIAALDATLLATAAMGGVPTAAITPLPATVASGKIRSKVRRRPKNSVPEALSNGSWGNEGRTEGRPEQAAGRGVSRRGVLTSLALGGAGLAGGAVLAQRIRGGPVILGPEHSTVGDEVAFALPDGPALEWRVGQRRSVGPVLRLRPTGTGTVTITARTASGTLEHTLTVSESDGPRIVGPAHLPLGQATELDVAAPASESVTWSVAGRSSSTRPLILRPSSAGLVTVQVTTGDRTATRTFTAAPPD